MSGRLNGKSSTEMDTSLMSTATATITMIQHVETNYYTQSPLYDSEGDESSRRYYRHEASPSFHQQTQESSTTTTARIDIRQEEPPFLKRILVVDNEPDVSLTFKSGIEAYLDHRGRRMFEVYVYASPLEAISEFRPNFYDLLLTDVYMPNMNGFQLSQKILELDINVRVSFISAAEVNIGALRELYPTLSLGCFIKKPIEMEDLAKRLSAELE